jgi:hypothetical protein
MDERNANSSMIRALGVTIFFLETLLHYATDVSTSALHMFSAACWNCGKQASLTLLWHSTFLFNKGEIVHSAYFWFLPLKRFFNLSASSGTSFQRT